MSEWEYACLREAWTKMWAIKEQWRNSDLSNFDAMYEIETIMDETGE